MCVHSSCFMCGLPTEDEHSIQGYSNTYDFCSDECQREWGENLDYDSEGNITY